MVDGFARIICMGIKKKENNEKRNIFSRKPAEQPEDIQPESVPSTDVQQPESAAPAKKASLFSGLMKKKPAGKKQEETAEAADIEASQAEPDQEEPSADEGPWPTTKDLEGELNRVKHKKLYGRTFWSTISTMLIVAAAAVLIAKLWMPVLQIYGNSMSPTLNEGDLIVSVKRSTFERGDVIAFYYNNKILVKRVIGIPGDTIDIDEEGNVYVNGELLDEPYVSNKAQGETDIEYPYLVPDNRWFVMGDHREITLDSRKKAIGTVAEEQVVGKLLVKIWPLGS